MRRTRTLLLPAALLAALAPAPAAALAGGASANTAALQVALRALHQYRGGVDGVPGPGTKRATRRFQARHHLPVDGVAGPRTRRALGARGGPLLGSRVMSRGQRGWDVAALQFMLRRRGYSVSVDGGFGGQTEAAVRALQRSRGIAADGHAGAATLRALRTSAHRRRVASAPSSGAPSGPVRFLRPFPGPMGDGFGYPGGRRHDGIDFPAPMGRRVGAAGVGTVVSAGWNSGGYGNLVIVQHRLGYQTWYAHLSGFAVHVGEPVAGGTVIGYVGATGRATGPHLHFEVRHNGIPINPAPLLLSEVSVAAVRRDPLSPAPHLTPTARDLRHYASAQLAAGTQ